MTQGLLFATRPPLPSIAKMHLRHIRSPHFTFIQFVTIGILQSQSQSPLQLVRPLAVPFETYYCRDHPPSTHHRCNLERVLFGDDSLLNFCGSTFGVIHELEQLQFVAALHQRKGSSTIRLLACELILILTNPNHKSHSSPLVLQQGPHQLACQ